MHKMAIIVKGANKNKTAEAVIQKIIELGIQDKDGNELELITLLSTKPVANVARVHGFQDTIVDATDMTFYHEDEGKPGTLKWIKDEWASAAAPAKAQLAATPFNKKMLAASYREKNWKIAGIHFDSEIRAMNEKMRSEMTLAEREADDARVNSLHSFKSGSPIKSVATGKTINEDELDIERKNLRQKAIELQQKEDDLKAREAKLTSTTIPKFIEAGGTMNRYTRPEIENMNFFDLKRLGKDTFGLAFTPATKKPEAVEMVLQAQEQKQEAAQVAIEG
jgi:hypothetical protein